MLKLVGLGDLDRGSLDEGDQFGRSLVGIPDLDGNLVPDLVIGSAFDDDGGTDRGAVYVTFLDSTAQVVRYSKISATRGGLGEPLRDGSLFGWSVASLGDIDRDGYGDLAVGAPMDIVSTSASSPQGAVYVVRLRSDGTVKGTSRFGSLIGGFNSAVAGGSRFGASVAGLGDLNGDNVGDVAVGVPAHDKKKGGVWVCLLSADGHVQTQTLLAQSSGGFQGTLNEGDHFGWSVALVGDIQNDGLTEIAVGAPFTDDGGPDKGAVWIVSISRNGTASSYRKISALSGGVTGPIQLSELFGWSLAKAGDRDGDGVPDLLVGIPNKYRTARGQGTAWVVYLGTDKASCAIFDYNDGAFGLDENDMFGSSVTVIGDLDVNGVTDIAIGAPFDDDGAIGSGSVHLVRLNIGSTTTEEVIVERRKLSQTSGGMFASSPGEDFPKALTGLEDVDGDGSPDLAAGQPSYSSNRGAVWVFLMRDDGSISKSVRLTNNANGMGTVAAGEYFGSSIASLGDISGDGVTDIVVGAPGTSTSSGRVYLLYLTNEGIVHGYESIDQSKDGAPSLANYDNFGTSLAFLRTMGEDTIQLAVGAAGDRSYAGAVYVVEMNRRGRVEQYAKQSAITGKLSTPPQTGNRFGSGAACPGDIDDDGIMDLVVTGRTSASATDPTRLWILFLDVNGNVARDNVIQSTEGLFLGRLDTPSMFYSLDVATAGDLNFDGIPDLLMGIDDDHEDDFHRGGFQILFLDRKGEVVEIQRFDAQHPLFHDQLRNGDDLGTSFSLIGDIDGDDMPELAIGNSKDDDGGADHGAIWILSMKKLLMLSDTPSSGAALSWRENCQSGSMGLRSLFWVLDGSKVMDQALNA